MSATSISLLELVQENTNDSAWQRLVDLYTPLIRNWLRCYFLRDQDTDDLVQDVLSVVVRRMPEFRRREHVGSFRRWLRRITVNCLRGFWRSQRWQAQAPGNDGFAHLIDQLEDSHSALSKLWDQEHDEHVTRRLLEMIRPRFQETTWTAFSRVVLDGVPAEQVAQELGISVNAVFIAKSRVVHMLRKKGQGLIEV